MDTFLGPKALMSNDLMQQICYLAHIHALRACHTPSQLDPEELSHMHIHLTMDHDSTQLMHCHAWATWNIPQPAISNINRYLWAGRDGALTAHTPYSFTSSIIH